MKKWPPKLEIEQKIFGPHLLKVKPVTPALLEAMCILDSGDSGEQSRVVMAMFLVSSIQIYSSRCFDWLPRESKCKNPIKIPQKLFSQKHYEIERLYAIIHQSRNVKNSYTFCVGNSTDYPYKTFWIFYINLYLCYSNFEPVPM